MSKDVFQPLRQVLVDDIYVSFGARLLAVRGSDLTYVFWHPDDEYLKKMIADKDRVCKCLKRIYSCGKEKGKLGLKVAVSVKRDVSDHYRKAALELQDGEQDDSTDDLLTVDSVNAFEQNVKGELNEIRETLTMMHETLMSVVQTVGDLKARTVSGVQCTRPETVGSEDVSGSAVGVENVVKPMDKTDRVSRTINSEDDPEGALKADVRRLHEHSQSEVSKERVDQATRTGVPVQDDMRKSHSSDTGGKSSGNENLGTQKADTKGDLRSTSSSGTSGKHESVKEQNVRLEKAVENHRMLEKSSVASWSNNRSPSTSGARHQHLHVVTTDNVNETERRAIVIAKNFETAESFLDDLNVSNVGDARFNPSLRRLTESVALAMEPPVPAPVRAVSLDTMLCLDISESLGEDGFEEMKATALKFLNDVEDIAQQYNAEENIGLVVMGGRPRVVHQLTNDYGVIREAIDGLKRGGKSPIFEAVCVCVAALKQCGSTLVVGGRSQLHPRVIFFTDGQATEDGLDDGPDEPTSEGVVQHQIVQLCENLRQKRDFAPMFWVPVGKANKMFLSNLSSQGSRTLVAPKDISFVSSYYRIEETVGRIHAFMESEGHSPEDDTFLSYIIDLSAGDMTYEEKVRVKDRVKEKMQDNDGNRPDDFLVIHEDAGLPALGSRVVRGPDFEFPDHDCYGPGTIIQHVPQKQLVWVHWDLSQANCRYRYGSGGSFDILVVDDQPRFLTEDEFIVLGIRVMRGPDWKFGDQDGGEGNTGVVIRKHGDVKVKVKWDSGGVFQYNYGYNGLFEVMVCDPETVMKSMSSNEHSKKQTNQQAPSKTATGSPSETVEASSDKTSIVWMWLDEGETWQMYTREQTDKLEKEFTRKPTGTCVIQRDGVGYRVVFKSPMSEKTVGKTIVRHPVQRKAVSEDELKSMKTEGTR